MYNKRMTDPVSYKPVTLGGMILQAQKKALGGTMGASPALKDDQAALADQVSLSPAAREKLTSARKVDGYLRFFGSFLKWLNDPGQGSSKSSMTKWQ